MFIGITKLQFLLNECNEYHFENTLFAEIAIDLPAADLACLCELI